jgi:hypothetical protein
MFDDARKAVCSACVVSVSITCIETILLTQIVNIDDGESKPFFRLGTNLQKGKHL